MLAEVHVLSSALRLLNTQPSPPPTHNRIPPTHPQPHFYPPTHLPACPALPADFEKGFIRAETVAFNDFVGCGGLGPAKEKGLLRLEGKEYVVKEGDVLMFRFNV
jgi:hypothetical protein